VKKFQVKNETMNGVFLNPKPATNAKSELAENPLWHEETNSIFWTDIFAGKIFQLNLATREHKIIYDGEPVGGFTFQQNGELLLFRVDDIALLSLDGKARPLRKYSDDGKARFNDVIAAPDGGVFAGTIGKTKESGGLYRVDVDGKITKLFSGTACSNGMGFSPDEKTFYWTCTTTRRIFQFDYDAGPGTISNQRIFYSTTPDEGLPDGLAVDAEGCIWSARWGGAAIVRHDKNGEALERISFPEKNITSICFAGKALDQMFVTAARANENSPPVTALFEFAGKISGRQEFRSKISIG
jgi:D-xylonolactonase